MPRARNDEQKQILTISLVLFVLLSLILAGVAYFGYAGQSDYEKEIKDLKAQIGVLRKDADEQTLVASISRSVMGFADKKDKDNIPGLKGKYKKTHDDEIAKHEKFVTWDATKNEPAGLSYAEQILEMKKKMGALEKSKNEAENNGKRNRDDYEKEIAAARQAAADLDKKLKDTSAKIDMALADKNKEYDDAIKKLMEALPNNEESLKKIVTLEAQRDKALADLKKTVADMEIRIRKYEEKIPQVDLLGFDQAKGKVITVDRGQTTVYINLGSADMVKPGLTFSVFGEGEYKATAERKASLEIVNVTDKHMSMARVTEIKNAARRPIVTGDQLYNPAWTPGLRDHVAIAGMIDLNSDGRDGTAEFVKALEKQGVIVDVWLDLKELQLKGALRKIGPKTSYLIIGDQPELDKQLVGDQIDPRLQKKMDVRSAVNEIYEDAKAKGVNIVDARRYMALAGMKVPKPQTEWNSSIYRTSGRVGQEEGGEKKEEKEMKKPEKKEEEKKEDK